MSDFFALFGLPAKAVLDAETLQEAYLAATRAAHPDQAGGDSLAAAELNAALETLKAPHTRLKHLLEHHASVAWKAVPLEGALMSIFEKLGPLLQRTSGFLKKKQAAATALGKALLAPEELRLREELEELGLAIDDRWTQLEQNLPGLDARLAAGDDSAWQEVQATQARFAYLNKWRGQVRESLLGLML